MARRQLSMRDESALDRRELSSEVGSMHIEHHAVWSTFWGPQNMGKGLKGLQFPRGMYGRNGRLEEIGTLLIQGLSSRAIARQTRVSKDTVAKLRTVLEIQLGRPLLCLCGKISRHQGWCRVRYQQSPVRQATMQHLHEQQRHRS